MDVKLVLEILTALYLAMDCAKSALGLAREVMAAMKAHKRQNNG